MVHVIEVKTVAIGQHNPSSNRQLRTRQSDPPEQHPDMKRQGRIMRVAINSRTVDVCAFV